MAEFNVKLNDEEVNAMCKMGVMSMILINSPQNAIKKYSLNYFILTEFMTKDK